MKHCGVRLTILLSLLTLAPLGTTAAADAYSDLKSQVEGWRERAQALYRLNSQALATVWAAYCGQFDPSLPASLQSATEIGLTLQHEQDDQIKSLRSDLRPLRADANALRNAADATSEQRAEVDVWLEELAKVERNLEKLDQGVILRGANHPFVNLALEYGKKMHVKLCDDYKGEVNVCDQTFPTLSGTRPDLVMVDSTGLWVLEFKPDNSDAKRQGWDKLPAYAEGVLSYYEQFFPQGPKGPTEGVPESHLGGQKILDVLAKTPEAWDGQTLKVHFDVRTYALCDQPYDELR